MRSSSIISSHENEEKGSSSEKLIELTEETIEKFHQCLIDITLQKNQDTYPAAKRAKDNYIVYLKYLFSLGRINEVLIKSKKNILIVDITCLRDHHAIDAQLANSIIDDIDVSRGEKVKQSVAVDDRENLIERMENAAMQAEHEAASRPMHIPKIISGFAREDKQSHPIRDLDSVETTTNAEVLLLAEARRLLDEHKFEELISRVQGIISERESAAIEGDEAEKKYLAVCNYILAKSLFAHGMDNQEQGHFDKAIELISNALAIVEKLAKEGFAKAVQDKADYHQALGVAYDMWGDACRKNFKYHEAFDHANEAIRVLKTIVPTSPKKEEEKELNINISRRKSARAKYLMAIESMAAIMEAEDKHPENFAKMCEPIIRDLSFSIKTLKRLISVMQADRNRCLAMQTELNDSRIVLADVYSKLTKWWDDKNDLVNMIKCCKNVIDALMPVHKAGNLGEEHKKLLLSSDKLLLTLVCEYQVQHKLPVSVLSPSGYAPAVEILRREEVRSKAWDIMVPNLLGMVPREMGLFGGRLSKKIGAKVAAESKDDSSLESSGEGVRKTL